MACFHPNVVTHFPKGFKGNDGRLVRNKDGSIREWKFFGAAYEDVLPDGREVFRLVNHSDSYVEKFQDVYQDGTLVFSELVPCQQCIGCRIDYSRHWADRIVMESLLYPEYSNFFVTLTYDDDHLYHNLTGYELELLVNGQYQTISAATLVLEDVQKFLKSLREYYSRVYNHVGIRVYYCGEYGSKTRRPHYHLCLFNLPIQDLTFYSRNFRGDILYNSPTLEMLWGKGYVVIGELTWESAAYTARYVVKKFKGKQFDEFYDSMGHVLPEFSHSSNRPGIAAGYFEKYKTDIYKYDAIQLPSSDSRKGITTVPRYFDKLLERYQEENPSDDSIDRLDKIKFKRRELADLKTYNERILNGLFDKEYFSLKEQSFNKRISGLQRSLDI